MTRPESADERPALPSGGPKPVPTRVRPTDFSYADVYEVIGCALAAVAATWLLFYRFTPLFGAVGFVVMAYVLFLLLFSVVAREVHGPLIGKDRVVTALIASSGVLVVGALLWIVWSVISNGVFNLVDQVDENGDLINNTNPATGEITRVREREQVLTWSFFTDNMVGANSPEKPPSEGGALHAIVGSGQQVGLALLMSVPLAVMTAIYLNEVRGRLTRATRFIVDAMSGIPSIVAGLFIYTLLIIQFGWEQTGFAGALALAVLMLPTVTRTSEVVLRLVPGGLREASLAMGAPEWRTALQVVLPTARAGVITAVLLGIARVVGETAPVLLTTRSNLATNFNAFEGAQENLPLFIYNQIRSPEQNQIARAWAGALVLVALVLLLFTLSRIVGRRRVGQRGPVGRLFASIGSAIGRLLPKKRTAPEHIDLATPEPSVETT